MQLTRTYPSPSYLSQSHLQLSNRCQLVRSALVGFRSFLIFLQASRKLSNSFSDSFPRTVQQW